MPPAAATAAAATTPAATAALPLIAAVLEPCCDACACYHSCRYSYAVAAVAYCSLMLSFQRPCGPHLLEYGACCMHDAGVLHVAALLHCQPPTDLHTQGERRWSTDQMRAALWHYSTTCCTPYLHALHCSAACRLADIRVNNFSSLASGTVHTTTAGAQHKPPPTRYQSPTRHHPSRVEQKRRPAQCCCCPHHV